MARSRIKVRAHKDGSVHLNIDNAQPLGTIKAPSALPEEGQDAEASDYPAKVSRPGGKKNRNSAGIVTKGKGRAGA